MSWGLNCSQVHGTTLRSVARPNSPLWVKGPLEEQQLTQGSMTHGQMGPRGDLYLERD